MDAVAAAMILNLIKSALKNKIFWYLVSRYLTFGIQFITSIYIAVKLGAYYFGIWSFVLLLINIGNQFNWGIGNALNIIYVQNKDDREKCRCYCFNAMLLTFLIMIPVILFTLYERIFGIVYFQKYQLGNMIYGVALVICLNYVNTLLMNISRVKGHFFAIAFNQSVFPVLTLILMFCTNGMILLYLLLGGYVAAMFLSSLLYYAESRDVWTGKPDSGQMCQIWKKGIYLFFYNACFYLIVLSAKLIITCYYSVEEFGYFAFAFGLANAAMMLVDSFIFLAFPKMIDMMRVEDNEIIQKKIDFLRQCYFCCICGIIYLALPACFIIMKLIPLYRQSLPIFIIILLALSIYPYCYGYNTYMLAHNHEQIMALFAGIALLVNIAVTYALVALCHVSIIYSMLGVICSYMLYSLAVNVCASVFINKSHKIPAFSSFFPLYVTAPLGSALALAAMQSRQIFWIPFCIFLLLGIRPVLSTIKVCCHLLKNPQVLCVESRK